MSETWPLPLRACWAVGAGLAECPHWMPDVEALLWVDIAASSVNILDIATGISTATILPAKVGAAVSGPTGTILLALESGLWLQDGRSLRQCAAPDMTGTHFNDGKCDAAGRFWVGSRANDGTPGQGNLYRLDPSGVVQKMAGGFDVCNGLGWSPEGNAFYLVDTVPRLLYRYDFDPLTGSIANRRVLQDFAEVPGKPDGLAVDVEGNIWCAMWDGSGIQVLSPAGEKVGWVDTPCPRPTSCAFGGNHQRTLFVTSAAYGLDPADTEHFGKSGSILAFDAPVAGVPVVGYAAAGM